MYYPSRYNHLVELKKGNGASTRIITNLFFGASVFVNEDVFRAFDRGEKKGVMSKHLLSSDVWSYFLDRGFVWTNQNDEEELVKQGGFRTDSRRENIAAQLNGGQYAIITSYHCNLACPYCFQRKKAKAGEFLTPNQIDLALKTIQECEDKVSEIKGQKTSPAVAITGGEPLLRNRSNRKTLDYLLDRLIERNWRFSITSNGVELQHFIKNYPPLKNCHHIQVTLDGPRLIHDQRRYFHNKAPSFDKIVESMDSALAEGWKITLRANLDMQNVAELSKLAEFVKMKGWLDLKNFYTYVSPITDHGNLGGYDTPKNEADLLAALLDQGKQHPVIHEVFDIRHFRGFNYIKRILMDKQPRNPVFFRCEAVMGMLIFDPRGDLYVCLEAAGDEEFKVGRYDPNYTLNEQFLSQWMNKNVLDMPECSDCKIRFICAGGCAMDRLCHGDTSRCMPFLREMEIAWSHFYESRPDLFA